MVFFKDRQETAEISTKREKNVNEHMRNSIHHEVFSKSIQHCLYQCCCGKLEGTRVFKTKQNALMQDAFISFDAQHRQRTPFFFYKDNKIPALHLC